MLSIKLRNSTMFVPYEIKIPTEKSLQDLEIAVDKWMALRFSTNSGVAMLVRDGYLVTDHNMTHYRSVLSCHGHVQNMYVTERHVYVTERQSTRVRDRAIRVRDRVIQ